MQLKPWQYLTVVILIACGAVAALYYYRKVTTETPGQMVSILPRQDASVFYVNVGAIRDSGLLSDVSGPRVTEEPEYKDFVAQTNFDYQSDLDQLAGATTGAETYLLLAGRFDWKKLNQYARSHGGRCLQGVCSLPASRPNHWISFMPLRSNLMGLAISDNQRAVYSIGKIGTVTEVSVPKDPVWIMIPHVVLAKSHTLPPIAAALAGAMGNATTLTLSLANPSAQTGIAGLDQAAFLVRMEARFDSDTKAVDMESQLVRSTNLVKTMVETRQAPAGPTDLASILMRGTFQNASGLVTGSWPVSREFVNSLLR
ncbi:MAG: hypothetical protein WBW33_32875 [Bryobacteraceae bacterium]